MRYNEQLERAILGELMYSDESLVSTASFLKETDFYFPHHKKVFNAILALYKRTGRVDFLGVHAELNGKISVSDISELIINRPVSGDMKEHTRKLREYSIKRELELLGRVTEENIEKGMSGEEILSVQENKILELRTGSEENKITSFSESAGDLLKDIDEGRDFMGITSGIGALDEVIGGFPKQGFVIIGARPSMGKTAIALKMAHSIAQKGHGVGFISLEMSAEHIAARLLSIDTQVELGKILSGNLGRDDREALEKAKAKNASRNLFIDTTSAPNILQAKAIIRKMMRMGAEIIFLDYAQLMSTSRGESEQQQYSELSKGLKHIAKEFNIPLVVLSQLSRKVEDRGEKEPIMSDLRSTGSWEQDADLIMFIHRYDYQELEAPIDLQGKAALVIRKHRNGPIGKCKLRYLEKTLTFTEEL